MKNQYAIPLSWRNAALIVAATLALWVAPWTLWPAPRPLPHGPPRHPLSIRYVRTSDGIDGAVWSALVFPVPTKEGFSKRAEVPQAGQDIASFVKPWVAAPPFVELPAVRHGDAELGVLTLKEEVAFRPEAAVARAFPLPATNRAEGVRIEPDDTLRRWEFAAPSLAGMRMWEGVMPWNAAAAWVEADSNGSVRHVFLDSSSGQTNVDAMIVRGLLSATAVPGAGPVRGRVRVHYWKNARSAGETRE